MPGIPLDALDNLKAKLKAAFKNKSEKRKVDVNKSAAVVAEPESADQANVVTQHAEASIPDAQPAPATETTNPEGTTAGPKSDPTKEPLPEPNKAKATPQECSVVARESANEQKWDADTAVPEIDAPHV